jgi:hypothetical protein
LEQKLGSPNYQTGGERKPKDEHHDGSDNRRTAHGFSSAKPGKIHDQAIVASTGVRFPFHIALL